MLYKSVGEMVIGEVNHFLKVVDSVEGGKKAREFDQVKSFLVFCNQRSWGRYDFPANPPFAAETLEAAQNYAARKIIKNAVITAHTVHVPVVEVGENLDGGLVVIEYTDPYTPNFGEFEGGIWVSFVGMPMPIQDKKVLVNREVLELICSKYKTRKHLGWITLDIDLEGYSLFFEELGQQWANG